MEQTSTALPPTPTPTLHLLQGWEKSILLSKLNNPLQKEQKRTGIHQDQQRGSVEAGFARGKPRHLNIPVSKWSHKAKYITPLITWGEGKEEMGALGDLLWKDARGPSSIRWTLEPFQRQRWGNFWETGWSTYGLFRAHRYHLELNSIQNSGRVYKTSV